MSASQRRSHDRRRVRTPVWVSLFWWFILILLAFTVFILIRLYA